MLNGIKIILRLRCFDHFYRALDPDVRKRRGTGIGLTIVRYIVEAQQCTQLEQQRIALGVICEQGNGTIAQERLRIADKSTVLGSRL